MMASGMGGSRRWWAVAALVLAALVVGIDATVLSLALPTLATALHASTADLQWFVAAYTLVFAAAMIPGGMLGDRYGRKKLLLIALVIFGASSLACAYSPSPGAFIAARAFLGLGGAVMVPMILGVLPVLFSAEERAKAVAIVMAATMMGYPIGPILGGWLLTNYWWGSVFLINVPVVLIALIAVVAWLPESRAGERPRLDPVGIVASSGGLAVLLYGVIQAGQYGWGAGSAVVCFIVSAVVLAAFVLWERRARDPLVDLGLFRSASFSWGTILMTTVSFAMFGVLFAAPQYTQAILGKDAFGSGLRLLPMVGGLLAGAGLATRLAGRAGRKVIVGLGFGLLAAGLFAGATTSVTSGEALLATWIAVCGFGLGFAMPTAMDVALSALSPESSGVGSALLQAIRMVGGSFGAAILGSVLNGGYRGRLDLAGLPSAAASSVKESVFAGIAVAHKLGSAALLESVRAAFVHGMSMMLLVSGSVAVAGVVLALVFLPRRAGAAEAATKEREAAPAPGAGTIATLEAVATERVESDHGIA